MSDYQSSALMVRRRPEVDIARSMQRFASEASIVVRKSQSLSTVRAHRPPGAVVRGWTRPDVEKAALGTALRAVGRGIVAGARGAKRVAPKVGRAVATGARVTGAAVGGTLGYGAGVAREALRGAATGARVGWRLTQPGAVAQAGRLIAPIDPSRAVGGAVVSGARHILKPTKQIASAAVAAPKVPRSAKTKAGVRAARGVKPVAAPETPTATPGAQKLGRAVRGVKAPGGPLAGRRTTTRVGTVLKPSAAAVPAAPKPAAAAAPAKSPAAAPAAPKPSRPRNPPLRYKKPGAGKQPGLPFSLKSDWSGAVWVDAAMFAKSIKPGTSVTLWQKPFRVHSYDAQARKYRLTPEKKIPNISAVKVHERQLGVPDPATVEPSVGTGTARRAARSAVHTVRGARAEAARQAALTMPGRTVKGWLDLIRAARPGRKLRQQWERARAEKLHGPAFPSAFGSGGSSGSARYWLQEGRRTRKTTERSSSPKQRVASGELVHRRRFALAVKGWLPSSPTRRAVGGRAADILARRKRERRADVSDAMTRRERRQGARATAHAEAREADYARAARKTSKADTILDRLDVALVRAEAREAALGDLRRVEMEKARAEMQVEAARPANESVTVEKNGVTVTLRRADTLAHRPEDIGRGC